MSTWPSQAIREPKHIPRELVVSDEKRLSPHEEPFPIYYTKHAATYKKSARSNPVQYVQVTQARFQRGQPFLFCTGPSSSAVSPFRVHVHPPQGVTPFPGSGQVSRCSIPAIQCHGNCPVVPRSEASQRAPIVFPQTPFFRLMPWLSIRPCRLASWPENSPYSIWPTTPPTGRPHSRSPPWPFLFVSW